MAGKTGGWTRSRPSSVDGWIDIEVDTDAYQADDVIGGKKSVKVGQTGTGASGELRSITLRSDVDVEADFLVAIFDADPAESTFTDDAVPQIHTNDKDKLVDIVAVEWADFQVVAVDEYWQATKEIGSSGREFECPDGNDLYLVVYCDETAPDWEAAANPFAARLTWLGDQPV